MKHKTHFLYYLFRPMRWVIYALLFCNALTMAQEQTPPEEIIFGASWNREFRYNEAFYNIFRASGLNFLSQYADPNPVAKGLLDGLNFYAANSEHPYEWIQYYSTSYYSKWEAEEDQNHRYKAGVKHRERIEGEEFLGDLIGSQTTFSGRDCWSTLGLTSPRDSLIYGPHYFQEKVYKRWYLEQYNYDRYGLKYTPRFMMALGTLQSINPDDTICRLKVVSRYRWQVNGVHTGNDSDMVLKSIYLKASDFLPYGEFKEFYLIDTSDYYIYPPEFREATGDNKRDFTGNTGVLFFDRWGDQGIQFCVDWLGDNSKCNLYIDYVEVYDNDGGQDFAIDPGRVDSLVREYAQSFPQSEWPNLKYWNGPDEPSSLDNYTPIKTVAAILDTVGAPSLMNVVWADWTLKLNGEDFLQNGYVIGEPQKLMRYFYTNKLNIKKQFYFEYLMPYFSDAFLR